MLIDTALNDGTFLNMSKRERLQVTRQRAKLEKLLGSIKDLTRLPAALFVVDVSKEYIAVNEARKLNIPVFGMKIGNVGFLMNRYSEDDVKAISRALTGYQVTRSSGAVTFNAKRHDSSAITILGTTQPFTGETLSDFLVARDDNATFIAERLWYRFISSTESMPTTFSAKGAFASRDIAAAVNAMATDGAMRDEKNDLVKAPVEWFISACRALGLTPSQLKTPAQLLNYLDKLGQTPFNPPNVGGWPAAEAWLSSATAQYRIAFAAWLIKQSDLSALTAIPVGSRVLKSADWLGVPEWSARTQAALRDSLNDPAQFALLALCSPEYIVSA